MRVFKVTDSVSIKGINQFIVCDSQSPVEITLSRSTRGSNGFYHFKNVGSAAVTITPQQSDTIDGYASLTLNTNDSVCIMDYEEGRWIITLNNYVTPQ
jgi:hypothetical protein